jgi:hypothetical protein
MKAIICVLSISCLTGCASKYSSHPGAALIGPGYLDTIADYPRDRDTQYYYPGFGIRNFELSPDASKPLPKPDLSPAVAALLTQLPEPSQQVKDITGKGYPCLEKTGIRLFTRADQNDPHHNR